MPKIMTVITQPRMQPEAAGVGRVRVGHIVDGRRRSAGLQAGCRR